MSLTADQDARERLIRMEAKLDSHLYRTTQAEAKLLEHDTRIRYVENGHARTLGFAAGISAIFASASAWITKALIGS